MADYDALDEAAAEWFEGQPCRIPRELIPLDEKLGRLIGLRGEMASAARDLQKSARRLRAAADQILTDDLTAVRRYTEGN